MLVQDLRNGHTAISVPPLSAACKRSDGVYLITDGVFLAHDELHVRVQHLQPHRDAHHTCQSTLSSLFPFVAMAQRDLRTTALACSLPMTSLVWYMASWLLREDT